MSMMLTLTDAAWASACDLARAGRRADARVILDTLLTRPDLSSALAAKAHRLAAALHIEADRFAQARRHLRTAIRHEPGNADTWHQLALAYESDPYGSDERALRHHWAAVRRDPANAAFRAGFARAFARTGADQSALRQIRAAVELAPTDVDVLSTVVEACREMEKPRTAWKIVCRARFLSPADQAIHQLWQRAKFDLAARGQRKPVSRVLPFVKLYDGNTARRDTESSIPMPHFGRLRVRG